MPRRDKLAENDRLDFEDQRSVLITDCVIYAMAPLSGEDPRFSLDQSRSLNRLLENCRLTYRLHHGGDTPTLRRQIAALKREGDKEEILRYAPPSYTTLLEEGLEDDEPHIGKSLAKTTLKPKQRYEEDDKAVIRQFKPLFEHCRKYVNNPHVKHSGQARINFEQAHQEALAQVEKLATDLAAKHKDFALPGLAEHFKQALNMAREIVLSEKTLMLNEALANLGRGRG